MTTADAQPTLPATSATADTRPTAGAPSATGGARRGRRALGTAGYAATQTVLLGLLFMVYRFGRHIVDGHQAEALSHGIAVWNMERCLRLPDEAAVQQLVLQSHYATILINEFYYAIHFPAAIALLVWVFVRHRFVWPRVRNVIIIATGMALVIHILYPLAPPRLLPMAMTGLIDTGAIFGPSPYAQGDGFANEYAAMPSLHIGWAIIEAWVVVTVLHSRWRYLAIAQPVATTAVVVATANHYWVDGVVGGLLVLLAVQVTRLALQARIVAVMRPMVTRRSDTCGSQ
ncbi:MULTISPECIES: phosphatase PAP2 family protein [Protofrankia]|uniref:Inositolphosphotransferase Aur1/Ipt1 domain-containing protein n=1 Tax=Protofrankia coriariae TaxID=1562887 RepID=A0ABR5F6Q5_9ACTN|nr:MULTISPECIES: phosphatase PAP2 family protein [Protofrankia]KLL12360.1 hypothetical protein FrCorBMG51_04895 [Protofrankia coriariae]ONH37328.1 inositol phosphorylceramide synthase [Protofrankia sp. BMG5.30]